MSRDNPIMYLRIPEDLKARIKQEAELNSRSMTGEIVYQLRRIYGLDRQRQDDNPIIAEPPS